MSGALDSHGPYREACSILGKNSSYGKELRAVYIRVRVGGTGDL